MVLVANTVECEVCHCEDAKGFNEKGVMMCFGCMEKDAEGKPNESH